MPLVKSSLSSSLGIVALASPRATMAGSQELTGLRRHPDGRGPGASPFRRREVLRRLQTGQTGGCSDPGSPFGRTKLPSEVMALAAWHDLFVKTLRASDSRKRQWNACRPKRRWAALVRHAHCGAPGPLRWSWATVTSQSADGWVGGEVVLALLIGDREDLLCDFVCVPGPCLFPTAAPTTGSFFCAR